MMPAPAYASFTTAIASALALLKNYGQDVDAGHWQGVPTAGKPDLVTREIAPLSFRVLVGCGPHTGGSIQQLVDGIKPNLPWADEHFAERISRKPTNPGESYLDWPWWRGQDEKAMVPDGPDTFEGYSREGEVFKANYSAKFTHTYQERFWPKYANENPTAFPRQGIRYGYGDLDDLIDLLLRSPYTRQAYLPIFFPEDTGAVHQGRIPCTLGYYFLLRNKRLHMTYTIRSCDAVRHFRDDLYLAARLLLWVIAEARERAQGEGTREQADLWHHVEPGTLTFTAYSFHVHKGDIHLL